MTGNKKFLEHWNNARKNLGFVDGGVLTTRGVIIMSICYFIASFCIVAASYKMAIPSNRPTVLDYLPLWALVVVGFSTFIAAIGIMSPVDDYIIHRDSSYERKKQRKKQKRSKTISSRRSNALRFVSSEFSSFIHSPYLEQQLDPAFMRWLYETLSFGRSKFDWSELYGNDSQFADQEAYEKYHKQSLEPYAREARDLVKIWKSAYAFDNLTLGLSGNWDGAAKSIQHIGKTLGIEEMISSYYEGVPLEIVISH